VQGVTHSQLSEYWAVLLTGAVAIKEDTTIADILDGPGGRWRKEGEGEISKVGSGMGSRCARVRRNDWVKSNHV
jgi:hypothetical protein